MAHYGESIRTEDSADMMLLQTMIMENATVILAMLIMTMMVLLVVLEECRGRIQAGRHSILEEGAMRQNRTMAVILLFLIREARGIRRQEMLIFLPGITSLTAMTAMQTIRLTKNCR